MSSSHWPNCADTVEEDFVKEICPTEFDDLDRFFDNHGSDFAALGYAQNAGDMPEVYEDEDSKEDYGLDRKCQELWDKLVETFNKRTGLSLRIGFVEAEERSDEVDGVYWAVDGVYQLSPAGKKYKDKITQQSWNTFG